MHITDQKIIEWLIGVLIFVSSAITAWGVRQWIKRGRQISKLAEKMPHFVSRQEYEKLAIETEALKLTVATGRPHKVTKTQAGYAIIEDKTDA